MYGDLSRGHAPDGKRGKQYRRVLLQQGRPLLDSDVAALVDAVLGEVRATTRDLSCAAGSPDLGFLVTPGRLLSVFAEAAGDLTVTAGTPDAWIDYRFRYLDRYPALHIAAGGAEARVTLPAFQTADPAGLATGALWARVEDAATIEINGNPVALAPVSPDEPQRVEFPTGGDTLETIEITVPAGEAVWLYLLEQDVPASTDARFSVAPGSFHADGLVLSGKPGGAFPGVSFPVPAGFPWEASPPDVALNGLQPPGPLAGGDRLVAYLELWERTVTAVEDAGIREEALGGTDTCARSELIGQVKLAAPTGALLPGAGAADALRAAFSEVEVSGGEVTIDVPAVTPTTDPCALPDAAGYSGVDNRLYRVEVHEGGGLSEVRLKWSRDNGAELYAARLDVTDNLVFDAGTALADGDLVEVLSNVVDLGDDALAEVSAGGFQPARRAVGQLAQLAAVGVSTAADEVVFRLVDPDDPAVDVVLDDRYGVLPGAQLKLRRWHGILDPQQLAGGGAPSPGPHVLEDQVTVELSAAGAGTYLPGQYWQYEARVEAENANGPWRAQPHGPERVFAPLALLEYDAADDRLELLAWLDERFSHPCELDADDIAFDGGRIGSASETVQEAIEELFERPAEIIDTSCGELVVRLENTLQSVFDTIPDGEDARLCIHPGLWEPGQTVLVENKGDLVISGAGDATRLGGPLDTVLRFRNCGHVRIEDLTVTGGQLGLTGDGLSGAISAIDCDGLDLQRVSVSCGDAPARRMSAVEVRRTPTAQESTGPEVRVRDCQIQAGHAQIGVLVVNASSVQIEGNTITSPQAERSLTADLDDPEVMGTVTNLLIRNVITGETEEANDELLVGSPDIFIEVESTQPGERRFIAHLEEWGYQFITFSTPLSFSASVWEALFIANPMVGSSPEGSADPGYVASRVREFRRRLARAIFGLPGAAELTAATSPTLTTMGPVLVNANDFAAGGQGVVVSGRGTQVDPAFPEPRVLTGPDLSDVRVTGNVVRGFVQGIHIGTSHRQYRGLTYRATVADNQVHLRVPSLSRERHGIFVGSVFHLAATGNTVELRTPDPGGWATAPDVDGIRVYGTLGPLIQLRLNSVIGTRRGVVAHATNAVHVNQPGWEWELVNNAHVTAGPVVPRTVNW